MRVIFHVVRDSFKEYTFAVVSADVKDEKLADEEVFLGKLKEACSQWIRTTPEGKKAWDDSCEDSYLVLEHLMLIE